MSFIISALARPLGPRNTMIIGTLLVVGGASYCVLRDLLICDVHTLNFAATWAAVTMLPWLAAFEGSKFLLGKVSETRSRIAAVAVVLVLTSIVSALIQWLAFPSHDWSFGSVMSLHIVSHFPETMIVALLTVVAAHMASSPAKEDVRGSGELPVDPARIRWLKSAGNYVEFRTDQRSHICRMTLRQAQMLLDPRQFIRISRSVIVNRDVIVLSSQSARDHVRLVDGSEHRIGDAYRAGIAKLD